MTYSYNFGIQHLRPRQQTWEPKGRWVGPPLSITGEPRRFTARLSSTGSVTPRLLLRDTDGAESAAVLIPNTPFTIASTDETGYASIRVSPQTLNLNIRGTSFDGRLILEEYPYYNVGLVRSLYNSLGFSPDPNVAKIHNGSNVYNGFKPISVTIRFDDGVVSLPDTLGKPSASELGSVSNEVLAQATVVRTVGTSAQSQQTTLPNTVWATRFTNLAATPNGVGISLAWKDPGGGANVAITSGQFSVDPPSGQITINIPPPTASYTQVIASYHYHLREASLRRAVSITAQAYPVTRNITDYALGQTPKLTPVNLDTLDPNYYPVYEYYMDTDGSLVFSQSFHSFSKTPATLNISYQSLNLKPRLMLDLVQTNNTTPVVVGYALDVDCRKFEFTK